MANASRNRRQKKFLHSFSSTIVILSPQFRFRQCWEQFSPVVLLLDRLSPECLMVEQVVAGVCPSVTLV